MANEMLLKYGCNPNQKPSRVFMEEGKDLPIECSTASPVTSICLTHLTAGSW